jgi:anti-sigma regulatory factor (Ser/Thr protein kinase)
VRDTRATQRTGRDLALPVAQDYEAAPDSLAAQAKLRTRYGACGGNSSFVSGDVVTPKPTSATPWFGPVVVVCELPLSVGAASVARRCVRRVLVSCGAGEGGVQWPVLVASELVSNAVTHGVRPPFAVVAPEHRARGVVVMRLLVHLGRVVVQVADSSIAEPVYTVPEEDAVSGRGLGLVVAAGTWGSYRAVIGKVVWCALSLPGVMPRRGLGAAGLDDPRFVPLVPELSVLPLRGVAAVLMSSSGLGCGGVGDE